MTEGIIIAIIGAIGVVLAALIGLFKRSNNTGKNVKIKQKQGISNNGTQIGVQHNYNNNTTIKLGDAVVDDGTLIIDCGNASGGGGIRYEPHTRDDMEGDNKDE